MIPTKIKNVNSVKSENPHRILCCYCNVSDRLQILQIANIPNFRFERVVFPQQRLMFDAVPNAKLEIQTFERDGNIVTKLMACDRLRVQESSSSSYSGLMAS